MTRLRPTLGLVVLLLAFQAPALARTVDELKDSFDQGVELLRRGRNDEALKELQKVLAMSPSQEAAYALWRETPGDVWTDLLVEGGDFQLVAKRLIELARVERKARRNDAAEIQPLVKTVTTSGDAIASRTALRKLSAEHGEYAAPYLMAFLSSEAGGADDDRTVLAMHALSQMGGDVVPPLVEALRSPDAILRRNVSLVLGNIGDRRGAGYLLWVAEHDADASVQTAARTAAAKMKASGSAVSNFLAIGDAYHHRRDDVMAENDYSDAVWDFTGAQVASRPIPRFLYNDEMAKRAYYMALVADPASTDALAGLARAYVDVHVKVDEMAQAGQDVTEWKDDVDEARMALSACGVDALDRALTWSAEGSDASTAVGLCRLLGPLSATATPGLQRALQSNDGAIRAEAALALGWIAYHNAQSASPGVVTALAESAGREVMRIAVIIDGDAARARGLASALENQGMLVNTSASGARGLSMIRRMPGLDVLVLADSLPDVTTAQLIEEVRADQRTQAVPVLVLTKDAEAVAGLYGEKIKGTLAGPDDAPVVLAAIEGGAGGDRARAEVLAKSSAEVLARLAESARSDLSPAIPKLVNALAARPDPVVVPALEVLRNAGQAGHAAAVLAVLTDSKRSDETRQAAGSALAGILGRNPEALSSEGLTQLQNVVAQDTSVVARDAAARALGLVHIDPAARLELIRKVRRGASE
jgi:CheY-like chemotaxis protein/tetratricopeptide (TPR) repeat protein